MVAGPPSRDAAADASGRVVEEEAVDHGQLTWAFVAEAAAIHAGEVVGDGAARDVTVPLPALPMPPPRPPSVAPGCR